MDVCRYPAGTLFWYVLAAGLKKVALNARPILPASALYLAASARLPSVCAISASVRASW